MVSGDTSCLIYIIVLLFYSFTFFGLLDICGGNKVSRMMMMTDDDDDDDNYDDNNNNLRFVNFPGVTDNIEFPSQSTGNIVSISAPTISVQDLTICMWVRTQVEVNHPVGLISCLSGNNIEMEIRYDNDGPRTLELQVGNAVT